MIISRSCLYHIVYFLKALGGDLSLSLTFDDEVEGSIPAPRSNRETAQNEWQFATRFLVQNGFSARRIS
jgi:hypothetical protein